ncbi:DUF2958 domain-containing protein [Arthrobacter sp. TMT4-20]
MGYGGEFGYIGMQELESVRGQHGLPIERDLCFTRARRPKTASRSTGTRQSSLARQKHRCEFRQFRPGQRFRASATRGERRSRCPSGPRGSRRSLPDRRRHRRR